jgi:hypothetical protein
MTLPCRTWPLSVLIRRPTRTRWLPSSHCMLNYLVVRELFLMQYVAPIHMAHLPSCRATISSTKTLEVQTAVRPHVPTLSFSSPHPPLSGVQLNFPRHGKLLGHRQSTEMVRANPSFRIATTTMTRTMTHRFCQHRWPAITGMVGFRNHVGTAPLTRWVSPSSQQIAFARGTYLHLLLLKRKS